MQLTFTSFHGRKVGRPFSPRQNTALSKCYYEENIQTHQEVDSGQVVQKFVSGNHVMHTQKEAQQVGYFCDPPLVACPPNSSNS